MPLYLISYDLKNSNTRIHKELRECLEEQGAVRLLNSQWVVKSHESPERLIDYLLQNFEGLKDSDRLLVVKFRNVEGVIDGINLRFDPDLKLLSHDALHALLKDSSLFDFPEDREN